MKLTLIRAMTRSAVFELENGLCFRPAEPFAVLLDGQEVYAACNTNVFSVYSLLPGHAYTLTVRAGGEELTLDFVTRAETFFVDASRYGLVGDGVTDNTAKLQAALSTCPPGGTVYLPAGRYRSASLFLKSHTTLYLEKGAVILGDNDRTHYPILPGVLPSENEVDEYYLTGWEGNPLDSLAGRQEKEDRLAAPHRLHHRQPLCGAARRDGQKQLLLDHPPHVLHWAGPAGLQDPQPLRRPQHRWNTVIRNCLLDKGHGGIVIGSEMSGGVKDMVVTQCLMDHTDRGLRVKTRRGRGKTAVIDGLVFHNVEMNGVKAPFVINMFYFCDPDGHSDYVQCREAMPVDDYTPRLGSLTMEDIRATGAQFAGCYFDGLPEMPIGEVVMKNVHITFDPEAQAGQAAMADGRPLVKKLAIYAENVKKIELHNVQIEGYEGERLQFANVGSFEED